MSDVSSPAPRPVSLVTIAFVFFSFAIFALLARSAYVHHRSPAPQNEAAEHLSKDAAWKAMRAQYLADLRAAQAKQASSYAWVDQKAGIVQVPIDRAIELVIKDHAAH